MKALVVKAFGPLESMTLDEVAGPQPGADEALVDIKAASVNFPDLLVIQGKYQVLPPLPFSPGKECAGIVKAVGANVTRVKPGDRVLIQIEYGGYAQQVVAKAANCHVIPEAMSFTEAAAMGSFGGFVLAAAYKQLNFTVVKESVYLTAKTSAMVCWLFIGSSIFAAAFASGQRTMLDSTSFSFTFSGFTVPMIFCTCLT